MFASILAFSVSIHKTLDTRYKTSLIINQHLGVNLIDHDEASFQFPPRYHKEIVILPAQYKHN